MELKTEVRKIWPDMALGDEISSGSYGQVFNADWNGTEYALKAVRLRLTDSEYAALPPVQHIPDDSNEIAPEEPLRAYLNEVRILRRLRHHPHIVWIEDSAVLKLENEPSCYLLILMEKLESFTEYISRRKITEDLVRRIGIHLCLALEECERLSIMHRDIKPSNILTDREGNFLLADFGQARVLEKSAGSLSVQGTDSYIAPEVHNRFSHDRQYDHRADLYSLGIVLYELLNHRRLPLMDPDGTAENLRDYRREKNLAIAGRLDGATLPPPCEASEKMAAILLKACSYAPENRFQTARSFRTALETGELPPETVEELPSDEALPSDEEPSAAEEAPQEGKHTGRTIVFPLLAVLLLTAAGLLYYIKFNPAAGNAETVMALEEAGLTDHAIEFTDTTLETVIRKKAGKKTGNVMLSDIWDWDTFSCCQPYEGARDTDLSYIDESLWGKPVMDISCLQELTNLKALYLSGNSLRDLSRLQDLDALETLDLRGCTLESLDGIQNIPNLTSLNLANVKGLDSEDYHVLAEMKHLKSLDLKNTGVADLSFLQGMEALEELDFSGNPIEDYSPADALGIKYTVD